MGRYSNIDLSRYNSGYKPSTNVNDAYRKKQESENAVDNYGDFNYTNQGAYDSVINDILNRKDFSYDMNGDAFYQQYKDQYMALGKLAMDDTIGKASAMTGGYGNSYAVSAGSQAYQEQLDQLNDKIPELWALARTAYENDRAADYDKYNMLLGDRQTQYGEWTDGLNRLLNERGYYSDNYNNAYSQDYTQWADNRDFAQSQYWNEYNAGYQADRDAVTDAQFNAQLQWDADKFNTQLAEDRRQFNEQMAYNKEQAAKSSSSGGTAAVTSEINGFNNRLLSEKEFKESAEIITRGNRGNTGNGGFKLNGVTYRDYKDYIYKQLETDYSNGLMSEGTLNYLLDAYNF